jgi:peptide alpha-N-acetyltransferase
MSDAALAPAAAPSPPLSPPLATERGAYLSSFTCGGRAVRISTFLDESQLGDIMSLISRDLSEPYSVFTFRHFVAGWPGYTLLAHDADDGRLLGVVICKSELRPRTQRVRGYVAMLAVEKEARRGGLGRELVVQVLHRMAPDCDELVLETEVTNTPALRLYESLGFLRDKQLGRYYLNGNSAWRLKVMLS